ncbi:hypothetical protein HDU79_001772 [Rhizoclosmatium sp. JEL0117]|nr:hypothetical protein HDU79_001772 [Rhizoclosmatium sp. JEL0117]
MHAVIIGSGLVGAASALALHQVGIQSTLYDQVDLVQAAIKSGGVGAAVDFGDSGGSVLLASNALRVLKTLGLLDLVLASSFPSEYTTWFKINGTAKIALDAVNVMKSGGETDPALMAPVQILRSRLHNILMQACQKAGIRCYTGKKLVSVTEIEIGVVAQFADGSSATGDFLIGADGIHSAVRRQIFGESCKAVFTGAIGHIGVVRTKENNITLTETCAFYLEREKKQTAWTFKVSEELAAVQVMTFDEPQPAEGEEYRPYSNLPKESTRLADLMASWGVPKHVEEMMRKSFRISPAAIYDLPNLPSYNKGRVVLLGDSAHGMVPNAGLGLLTGLEDVGVLLELFRRFPDQKDLSKVLELYSKIRVPKGHEASQKSRDMAKQYYTGSSNMGHFLLRVGIFLFNHNWIKFGEVYDCPAEVAAAVAAL